MKKKLIVLLSALLISTISAPGVIAATIEAGAMNESILLEEHIHSELCSLELVTENDDATIEPYGAFCWLGIHSWSSWTETGKVNSRPGYCVYKAVNYKRTCDCGEVDTKTEVETSRMHVFNIYGGIVVQNGRQFRVLKCSCGASIQEPIS